METNFNKTGKFSSILLIQIQIQTQTILNIQIKAGHKRDKYGIGRVRFNVARVRNRLGSKRYFIRPFFFE
jgi:hypothetical protein